ncbi:MAG: 2-oxo acid dehydrogenase subunit E2 [Krumholzibacteria bacterium]|nr:2-oxo acid dehydrogenase subunit E2 [Candidatus Krumholzibacteria bacterium]
MAQEIRVPEVSDGVTEGKVISLSVAAGDKVEADQTLLELETDKAVVAIPSPFAGTITEVLVKEGDSVEIGAVIMKGEPGGGTGATPKAAPKAVPEAKPEAESEAEPEADTEDEPKSKPKPKSDAADREALPPAPESAPAKPAPDAPIDLHTVRSGDQVAPAAPSVRRVARDLGVDIYQVQGTGPGGRISEEDVRAFVRQTMQRVTGGGPVPAGEFRGLHAQRPLPDFTKWGGVTVEPLSRVRELTADAMGYAWSTIPMVTQHDECDVTDLEDFRKEFNRKAADDDKLTVTAILVKVCAMALRAYPQFNSSLDLARKELILKDYVHVGLAVDTPGGLLVPVIRDCDTKGIERLATELNALAEKTRERRISPADMEGGTFTISNLGGIGGTAFSPIVYAPQVAILGVSRAAMKPVWDGSGFAPRLVMPLTLTYDHRVIDGADGARFLRWICAAIEQPIHLVMKG